MDEYITKEAAIQAFEWSEADVIEDYGDGCNFGFSRDSIKGAINAIPAVDVAPVVHGQWLFAGDGVIECSSCHEKNIVVPGIFRNFCSNCGAKMKEME